MSPLQNNPFFARHVCCSPPPCFFFFFLVLSVTSLLALWVNMVFRYAALRAASRTAVRGAAAVVPQSGGTPQQVFCRAAITAFFRGTRELPFFPGRVQLRLLSTAIPGSGKVVTEDPTLLAANMALNDANVALAQARRRFLAAARAWASCSRNLLSTT